MGEVAPWEQYKNLARAKERRKKFQERVKHTASPITEPEADRTWSPGDRCTEDQLDAVFMFLEDYGPMTQIDLANQLSELLGLNLGTARGAVTGALFALQEMGFVEFTGRKEETEDGGKSRVWKVKQE